MTRNSIYQLVFLVPTGFILYGRGTQFLYRISTLYTLSQLDRLCVNIKLHYIIRVKKLG
jgi:hypothetical protein